MVTLWLEVNLNVPSAVARRHIYHPDYNCDQTRAAWCAAAYVRHGLEIVDMQVQVAHEYEPASYPSKGNKKHDYSCCGVLFDQGPSSSAEVRGLFVHDIKEKQQEEQEDRRDEEIGDEVNGEIEEGHSRCA